MIASAWRLNWTVDDYRTLHTDLGVQLDLGRASPATVKAEIIEAGKRWQWRRVAAVAPTGSFGSEGPRVQPLREILSTT